MDIQGHRGCRGLFPENTIQGFLHAAKLGVNTLELDTVITKDHQVIISHESFFNHEISTAPDGQLISLEDEKNHNIYLLSADQCKEYDVGLRPHPRFPDQQKMACSKPLLVELLDKTAEQYPEIRYNIEIKRTPAGDERYHPRYDIFADLLINTLVKYDLEERVSIQCFDTETLNYLHQRHLRYKLVYLVEEEPDFHKALSKIDFKPDIYSPDYTLVTTALIEYCRAESIELIPWTVNELPDIQQILNWNLDGIISDYPDRVLAAIQR